MKFLKTQNLSKYGLTDNKLVATTYGNYVMHSSGALRIPSGPQSARPQTTSADVPGGANGYIRYNTDAGRIEAFVGNAWAGIGDNSSQGSGSIVEVNTVNDLPSIFFAETGILYITTDTNFGYLWTGEEYILAFSDHTVYSTILIDNATPTDNLALVTGGAAKITADTSSNGVLTFSVAPSTSVGALVSWSDILKINSTGIYPATTNSSTTGTASQRWKSIFTGAGAAATPSLSFSPTNTITTGLYSSAEGTISFSSGGVYAGQIASGGNMTMVGNITANSDSRLKKDLEVIDNALEKVHQLTGYTYTRIDTGDRQTGIIAQDLEKVLPEAVLQNDEYKSVAYGNIVGLLIEAIKELSQEVSALRSTNV